MKLKDLEEKLDRLESSCTKTEDQINNLIIKSNNAFTNFSIAIQNLESRKDANDKLLIRQFCIQTAALCCQREGGDVISLANRIHDYVVGNPNQVIPENLVPLLNRKH